MTHEEQYAKWVDSLQTTHDTNYYENLLKYSDIILSDLEKYQQRFIAERLRLPSPTLSTFRPLLVAYNAMRHGHGEH